MPSDTYANSVQPLLREADVEMSHSYPNAIQPLLFEKNSGSSGSQGPQGAPGAQGAPGPQGHIGPQGNQGAVGAQGNQGDHGFQGFQGNQGSQGSVGAQGTQGNQGDRGFQGFQGNQGNQGNTGAQGFQGNQGTQGVIGAQGAIGAQGNQGFQGNPGNQGNQGNQGSIGAQGTQGSIGAQGNQGITGAQGNQGNQGSVGAQGDRGFQGFQGNQGNQGVTGSQGTQGFQGNQGNVGAQGVQGNQGNQGAVGSQGDQGFQGTQGNVGPQGAQGVTGAQGNQGDQGFQGNVGSQGNQGFQGNQGATGAQGSQGFQGVQGAVGAQGNQGDPASNDHKVLASPTDSTAGVLNQKILTSPTVTVQTVDADGVAHIELVVNESGLVGPPKGAAGGDLFGTYPDPGVKQLTGVSAAMLPKNPGFSYPSDPALTGIGAGYIYVNGLSIKAWGAISFAGHIRWSVDSWQTTTEDNSLFSKGTSFGNNWNALGFVKSGNDWYWVAGDGANRAFYMAKHIPANYTSEGTLLASAWVKNPYPSTYNMPPNVGDIAYANGVTCWVGNSQYVGRTTDFNTFTSPPIDAYMNTGGIATDGYDTWMIVIRDTGEVFRSVGNQAVSWSKINTVYIDGVAQPNLPTLHGEQWGSILCSYGVWVAAVYAGNTSHISYAYSNDTINWTTVTGSDIVFFSAASNGVRWYATNPVPNSTNPVYQLLINEIPAHKKIICEQGLVVDGDAYVIDLPNVKVLGTDINGKLVDSNIFANTQLNVSTGCVGGTPPQATYGSGTITIDAANVNLCTTTDRTGAINTYAIPGATFTLTDNTEQYIVADYNNGTPCYRLESNKAAINGSDIVLVRVCWRQGTNTHSMDSDCQGAGLANKIEAALLQTTPYRKSNDGGLTLSETSTPTAGTVLVSGAVVYAGSTPHAVLAFNSSTDKLTFVRHVAEVWTYSDTTVYNNAYYDDGTDLVALGNNKYTVNWIYRSIGDTKQCFYVLANTQYNTVQDAQGSTQIAGIPLLLRDHCMLVGRIIVQLNATTGVVENVADVTFGSSAITTATSHNSLGGLQGPGPDYYHLSSSQFTSLTGAGDSTLHYHASDRDPANMAQTPSYRFVTDTEKATWNSKQAGSSVLTSIATLSTGTGLLKLTNGSASLDTSTYATTTQLGSYLPLVAGSGNALTGQLYGTSARFSNGIAGLEVGVAKVMTYLGFASFGYNTWLGGAYSGYMAQDTGRLLMLATAGQEIDIGVNPGNLSVINIKSSLVVFSTNVLGDGSATFGSIVKSGGTESQFLKADGSVDTNTYLTGTSGMPSFSIPATASTITWFKIATIGTVAAVAANQSNVVLHSYANYNYGGNQPPWEVIRFASRSAIFLDARSLLGGGSGNVYGYTTNGSVLELWVKTTSLFTPSVIFTVGTCQGVGSSYGNLATTTTEPSGITYVATKTEYDDRYLQLSGGSLSGDLYSPSVSSTKYRVNSSVSDTINGAPWYGLGYSNLASGSGFRVQLAGYYGINFATGNANTSIMTLRGAGETAAAVFNAPINGTTASFSGALALNGAAMPAWGTGLNQTMLGGEAFLYAYKSTAGTQPTLGSNFYYDGTNLKTIATYSNSNYPRALLLDVSGTLNFLVSVTSPTAGATITDLSSKFSVDKNGVGTFAGSVTAGKAYMGTYYNDANGAFFGLAGANASPWNGLLFAYGNTYLVSPGDIQFGTNTAGKVANFSLPITGTTISLSDTTPLVFSGSGTGTYNKGAIFCNSTGVVIGRPRATDSSSGTPLNFDVSVRGDSTAQFSVGATLITCNLPIVGNTAAFTAINLTSPIGLGFTGSGTGSYNQGALLCDSNGFTFARPRATDSGTGTPLNFDVSVRGGGAPQFRVGATSINCNLPVTFLSNTWNSFGVDVQIGDINVANTLGLRGIQNNAVGFIKYGTGPSVGWDGSLFQIPTNTRVDGNLQSTGNMVVGGSTSLGVNTPSNSSAYTIQGSDLGKVVILTAQVNRLPVSGLNAGFWCILSVSGVANIFTVGDVQFYYRGTYVATSQNVRGCVVAVWNGNVWTVG